MVDSIYKDGGWGGWGRADLTLLAGLAVAAGIAAPSGSLATICSCPAVSSAGFHTGHIVILEVASALLMLCWALPPAAGDTLLRKFGRSEAIQKQSVPELVFAYFNNKYGQRALVDEYVGSLVNTLTLYKRNDLRLEGFARWGQEAGLRLAANTRSSASTAGPPPRQHMICLAESDSVHSVAN